MNQTIKKILAGFKIGNNEIWKENWLIYNNLNY